MRSATRGRRLPVLVVGAVLVAACGEGVGSAPATEVAGPMLMDPVPAGMEVVSVAYGEPPGLFEPDFGPLEVYGSGDGDPFDAPVFLVTTDVVNSESPADEHLETLRQFVRDLDDDDPRAGAEEHLTVDIGGAAGMVSTVAGRFEGRLTVAWPADDETLLNVSATGASADELVAVARHVSVADDGRLDVADAAGLVRIGGVDAGIVDRPGFVGFLTATPGKLQEIAVMPVSPEEQIAYRALMSEDPAQVYRTAASCCEGSVLQPPRVLEVAGRPARVGTLTPRFRALVVSGDPGFIVFSGGNRNDVLHSDDELVAVAESLRPATVEEVDAIVERQRREAIEESYDEAVRSLEEAHPGVRAIERVALRDRDLVLAAGPFAERGPDGEPGAVEPGLCAQYYGEVGIGLGCIRQSTWAGATTAAVGWYEGAIVVGDERLASVVLAPPGGNEIEGTVVPLDLGPDYPARIGFVYAAVELQADPEVDTRSGVPVVARSASGEELLRAAVSDLPSG